MTKQLRIALAQLDFTVGDIAGNLAKHIQAAHEARDKLHADLIVFPELSLTGYLAEDLFLRHSFIHDAHQALKKLQQEIKDIYCLVGHPEGHGHGVFNMCSLIYNGKRLAHYAKQCLPNYSVFDENRYFIPGNQPRVVAVKGVPLGIVICEDIWRLSPARDAAALGAKILICPNASPFEMMKHEKRLTVLAKRAETHHLPIVYVNHVGGQDELVFDGGSMVVDEQGHLRDFGGFFKENLFTIDLSTTPPPLPPTPSKTTRIYDALVLSVRDYIRKNHFKGALIGLSGGIDSALTLAIAVDALGKDHVQGILMPSRYTAEMSNEEAITLAANLGVKTQTISIEPLYTAALSALAPAFEDLPPNIAEENIQARCRGLLLMALSNKFGQLVLTTGNRSELAVGYCTLYGDMAGGFAVLKDVPKTLVYELAHYRNQLSPAIPQRIIDRPPTAELAFNQKDQDCLPPYPVLDKILECYIEKGESLSEIVDQGFERETVTHIINLIHHNEYKRRQAPVGPRINARSFGKDWRYPISSGYKR